MYGFILLAIALMALGGLMLAMNLRALERRAALVEEQTSRDREEARRAHVRLDNHQRQLEALGHELGWVDDRAHTKVITSKLPREEKE